MTETRSAVGERLAVVLAEHGMQRMAARVIAAFLVTEQPTLTQGEVAEQLEAGAGSVSSAIKTLIGTGQLERVPVTGSRREHYRLREDAWPAMFSRQNEAINALWGAVRRALAETDPDSRAHHRLQEMNDFYQFIFNEIPVLLDRWQRGRQAGPEAGQTGEAGEAAGSGPER